MLVGGFGAVEMESTGIAERPVALWAVMGDNPDQSDGRAETKSALRSRIADLPIRRSRR